MHKCWTLMWWLSKTVFGGYKYLAIKTCTNAEHSRGGSSKTVFGGYKYLTIKTCTNAGH